MRSQSQRIDGVSGRLKFSIYSFESAVVVDIILVFSECGSNVSSHGNGIETEFLIEPSSD